MIALMQEDTRIDRDEGGKNLTIGYFIMKVWCKKKTGLSLFSSCCFFLASLCYFTFLRKNNKLRNECKNINAMT